MTTEDITSTLDVQAIRSAWNRRTSASPEKWSRANRARGQCAITALVVQDCLGGKLIRTMATLPDGTEESHYATIHDLDVIVDLTDGQFPEGTEFGPWVEREREYVLSFPDTRKRYALIAQRLNEIRTLSILQEHGEPL